MSDLNETAVSRDARSNFGKKGWGVIIYSGVNWYIKSIPSDVHVGRMNSDPVFGHLRTVLKYDRFVQCSMAHIRRIDDPVNYSYCAL